MEDKDRRSKYLRLFFLMYTKEVSEFLNLLNELTAPREDADQHLIRSEPEEEGQLSLVQAEERIPR